MLAAERAKARTLWAGAERGPRRFKSDAVAGTYDENFGHPTHICFRTNVDKQFTY
jgi:hypothetical protein